MRWSTSAGKPLEYSFDQRYTNCTKEEAIALLESTTKPIVYTIGWEYRHPNTHRKPITKEMAVDLLKTYPMINVKVEDTCVHVQKLDALDME